jgi:hypothetical protein
MTKPVITIKSDEVEISDGFHTFSELYEHRIKLWIALCLQMGPGNECFPYPKNVWRSRKRSDGSELKGWFILGMGIKSGKQMSYHIPEEYWDKCYFADTFDKAPEFDGHTPADVLERLAML